MPGPFKVLITGITGSAGRYLEEYLAAEQPAAAVYGTSRRFAGTNIGTVSVCDLTDLAAAERVVEWRKPDVIFNLAAKANVRESWHCPHDYVANNTLATGNLLEAVKRHAPEATIVHCSTSEVYGSVQERDTPIVETQPLNPINPYAVSKLVQENLCDMYAESYGLRVITTRAFGYINPRRADLCTSQWARQIAEAEAGMRETIQHGNLNTIRTFMDVRDVVRAYWQAACSCEPGVYNIGSTEAVAVGGVLESLMDEAILPEDRWIRTEQSPDLMRPADVTNQVPNVSRFLQATCFEPHYTLDDSLSWLLDYYRRAVYLQAAAAA